MVSIYLRFSIKTRMYFYSGLFCGEMAKHSHCSIKCLKLIHICLSFMKMVMSLIIWVPFSLILTLFQLFLVSFFTRDIQHQLQRELSHPELCMYITDKEVVGFLSGSRRDARPQKRKMKSTVLSAFPLRLIRAVLPTPL